MRLRLAAAVILALGYALPLLMPPGKALKPGGIYRAKVGDQQIVFAVDPAARDGAAPAAGRLLRFQPTS